MQRNTRSPIIAPMIDARRVLDTAILDAAGAAVTLRAQQQGKPLVVVFLRHFG